MLFTLFSLNTFAQDYTQLSLPDGAKARLGKGSVYAIADSELSPTTADVNSDGLVNVLDLIFIASSLGQSEQNDADVNGDRVVSILDLVLAAGMFEGEAAAPSAQRQAPEHSLR